MLGDAGRCGRLSPRLPEAVLCARVAPLLPEAVLMRGEKYRNF